MVKHKENQMCYYSKVRVVVAFVGGKVWVIGRVKEGGFWDAADVLFLDLGLHLLYYKLLNCTDFS